jgi:hypothetical protein
MIPFFDRDIEEQNQIADHIFGMVARRDGEPFDRSKTPAWQRGWAGASFSQPEDLLRVTKRPRLAKSQPRLARPKELTA